MTLTTGLLCDGIGTVFLLGAILGKDFYWGPAGPGYRWIKPADRRKLSPKVGRVIFGIMGISLLLLGLSYIFNTN